MGFFTQVIDDMLCGFEKSLDDKNTMIIPELEKQLYSWSIECKLGFSLKLLGDNFRSLPSRS